MMAANSPALRLRVVVVITWIVSPRFPQSSTRPAKKWGHTRKFSEK
jgi:hypothetical protein